MKKQQQPKKNSITEEKENKKKNEINFISCENSQQRRTFEFFIFLLLWPKINKRR